VKGIVSRLLPAQMRRLIYQSENATPHTTLEFLHQKYKRITPAGRRTFIVGPHRDSVMLLRKPR
jgi:hypothetical protein